MYYLYLQWWCLRKSKYYVQRKQLTLLQRNQNDITIDIRWKSFKYVLLELSIMTVKVCISQDQKFGILFNRKEDNIFFITLFCILNTKRKTLFFKVFVELLSKHFQILSQPRTQIFFLRVIIERYQQVTLLQF